MFVGGQIDFCTDETLKVSTESWRNGENHLSLMIIEMSIFDTIQGSVPAVIRLRNFLMLLD